MDSEFKLYIYPDEINYQSDITALSALLNEIKVIGQELSKKRYATGDEFLSFLTFMGCSPNIELEPQNEKPFCYIEIDSFNKPLFITGKNTKYPNCPHCKKQLKALNCLQCNKQISLNKLNWRKSAFIASSWICFGNIYELEAIPNDELLRILEQETGLKWKYAYIRQTSAVTVTGVAPM